MYISFDDFKQYKTTLINDDNYIDKLMTLNGEIEECLDIFRVGKNKGILEFEDDLIKEIKKMNVALSSILVFLHYSSTNQFINKELYDKLVLYIVTLSIGVESEYEEVMNQLREYLESIADDYERKL